MSVIQENKGTKWSAGGQLRFYIRWPGEDMTEQLTYEYRCKGSEKVPSVGGASKQKQHQEGNI